MKNILFRCPNCRQTTATPRLPEDPAEAVELSLSCCGAARGPCYYDARGNEIRGAA